MRFQPIQIAKPDQAKRVILELLRQSTGNRIEGKKRLAKAFYFAHLYFARSEGTHLTEWPIVKMPEGPGIDQMDSLLDELEREGAIRRTPVSIGPYPGESYEALAEHEPSTHLSDAEIRAIRQAAEFIVSRTGAELSELTHDHSHTWNDAEMGAELPISLDLLSDEAYASEMEKAKQLEQAFTSVWSD